MKKRFVISASTFDKRGRLISSANNSYHHSSKFMRYYAIKAGEPEKKYNHAEIRALELALRASKAVDTLVVMRYDTNGNLADAKPCNICQLCIRDMQVKTVRYSTKDGMKVL